LRGLQELFKGSNWVFYVQDGPVAGQTVPHTHIHFYPIPSRAKLAMSGLQHMRNQRKVLSEQELRASCIRFEKKLLEILSGN
jgi:diadenosine tetraphosphate (Ap4A) HIT family hydrolase